MFSTSTNLLQNQVILPLSYVVSQYSSVRGTRPSVSPASYNKKLPSTSTPDVEILCSESLAQTIEKAGDSGLKEIASMVTPQLLRQIGLHGPKQLQTSSGLVKEKSEVIKMCKNSPWYESHISAANFLENKHGHQELSDEVPNIVSASRVENQFSGDARLRPLFDVTRRLLKTNPQLLSTSNEIYRGFKTQQSRDREMLKKSDSGFNRILESISLKRGKDSNRSITSELENNTKLKGLLSEETTDEGRQTMKVAFAEGYLAADPQKSQSRSAKFIKNLQNILFIIVAIALLFSIMGGMGGSMFRLQVGNGNEVMPEEISVTFEDVKGVEEAKLELQEIVEFLRNPEKFTTLGAELPKGVLLVGPPGTGKTLLARAVAGEAGVPFFHAAGPEFDEILVGQGARRVRDLFRVAKMRAPCVIFIDEIDSVGSKRSSSVLHPYANQTINQLLAEMDGFHKNDGVIVLGATNRQEDLDKALLRPGRFDVEVQVPIPDLAGRKEIFDYYLSKIKQADDVELDMLGRGTTGFTGADIKNVTNQAALRAAADQMDAVSMKHLEAARDKVLMGPEKKSRIPDEDANKVTAYHEGGHTLVSHYTPHSHPLHKVTIMPRGRSLGHTASIPAKEQYHVSYIQLKAQMDSLMGGRAAEELIFGPEHITGGASSDLKRATEIAEHLVKDLGMSEKVGLRTYPDNRGKIGGSDELSVTTRESIDNEVNRLLNESYARAKKILQDHAKEHKALAEALLKYETLDADDIKAILDGKTFNRS